MTSQERQEKPFGFVLASRQRFMRCIAYLLMRPARLLPTLEPPISLRVANGMPMVLHRR
jgi:hypothetical protein